MHHCKAPAREDTNGNQIFIRYNNGLNSPWSNSSARIYEIEDVRAQSDNVNYWTWQFTYNTDAIPHLTNITSYAIIGAENYTFSYLESQSLNSPFSPSASFGTTTLLHSFAPDTVNPGYQFQYDSGGVPHAEGPLRAFCRERERHGIGIAPDGKTLWVTSLLSNSVSVFSLPDLDRLGTTPVGIGPDWLTFTPDNRRCYVSNAGSNSVSVLDVVTRVELAKIPVGKIPKRIICTD